MGNYNYKGMRIYNQKGMRNYRPIRRAWGIRIRLQLLENNYPVITITWELGLIPNAQ
jgi:hypothetical protein